MKTKAEIIEETYQVYSNPENRGVNEGNCVYYTHQGKMCAIGRVLIAPANMENGSLEYYGNCGWFVSAVEWDDKNLKEEYRGHEPEFWKDLQDWHDHPNNFTETAISERGERVMDDIRKNWKE